MSDYARLIRPTRFYQIVFVLIRQTNQIIGDATIQGPIPFVGHDVHIIGLVVHNNTGSPLITGK